MLRACQRITILSSRRSAYVYPSAVDLKVVRCFAKKVAPASGGGPSLQSQKKKLPAETDPERLATYCCGSNYRIEGQDVKLGADEDYPEWLWTLHLGRPKLPSELDRNTEDYWEALHNNARLHQNKLNSSKPPDEIRINEKTKLAKLEAIVHRALAYRSYDPGTYLDSWKKDRFRKYGPCGVYRRNQLNSPDSDVGMKSIANVTL